MKEGSEKADPSQFELLKVLGQGSFGKVSSPFWRLLAELMKSKMCVSYSQENYNPVHEKDVCSTVLCKLFLILWK